MRRDRVASTIGADGVRGCSVAQIKQTHVKHATFGLSCYLRHIIRTVCCAGAIKVSTCPSLVFKSDMIARNNTAKEGETRRRGSRYLGFLRHGRLSQNIRGLFQ